VLLEQVFLLDAAIEDLGVLVAQIGQLEPISVRHRHVAFEEISVHIVDLASVQLHLDLAVKLFNTSSSTVMLPSMSVLSVFMRVFIHWYLHRFFSL
jgi:hypothetical protein